MIYFQMIWNAPFYVINTFYYIQLLIKKKQQLP